MIRKLALTIASLALMATPVVAQPTNAEFQATWATLSNAERDELRASAYKVSIAYNFCRDIVEVHQPTGEFVVWFIAQAEGLTEHQASVKLDEVANIVWRKTPRANEPMVCANAAVAARDWRATATNR